MLLKRDAAPAGLVDSVNSEDGAASFFRGHRAFRATFYKEMVAQTFRIGFRPLAVGKTEDASSGDGARIIVLRLRFHVVRPVGKL